MAKGQRSNREIRKPKAAKAKRPLEAAAHVVPQAALAKPKGVSGNKGVSGKRGR